MSGRYGDNVNEMSWSVGEIIKTLKDLEIDENTFVLFISDHGPQVELCGHGGSTGILKGTTKLHAWIDTCFFTNEILGLTEI